MHRVRGVMSSRSRTVVVSERIARPGVEGTRINMWIGRGFSDGEKARFPLSFLRKVPSVVDDDASNEREITKDEHAEVDELLLLNSKRDLPVGERESARALTEVSRRRGETDSLREVVTREVSSSPREFQLAQSLAIHGKINRQIHRENRDRRRKAKEKKREGERERETIRCVHVTSLHASASIDVVLLFA